jgi:putative ABC transport system permease protein
MRSSISSIERISPEYSRYGVTLKSETNNLLVRVAGVWPDFEEMRNLIPQAGGRFINSLDVLEKRRVVFIGNRLAERLYGNDEPIGQTVLVNGIPFTIIGILKEKPQDSAYSGRDHSQAWIPSSTFNTMWSRRYPEIFIAQSSSPYKMPRLKKEIFRFMAGKYNFDPEDTEALSIWDTTEGLLFFSNFFLAFRAFLVAIGCMTLITGGIGVSNIMNVILEERTKEIGIKMAVGAKRYIIMTQFLIETMLLTAVGGFIGFVLATIIIKIFPASFADYVGYPELNIGGGFLAVAILGIIALAAGYFPARRAAGLEPVKALKLF